MDRWTPIKAMTLRGMPCRVSHMTANYSPLSSPPPSLFSHLLSPFFSFFFLISSPLSSSRLRSKWCSAVANRREFLDSELRKLMDRKGATVTEMERQNELLDQWAMLSWQRQALLEPRAGSGLPGAPTNWWALFGIYHCGTNTVHIYIYTVPATPCTPHTFTHISATLNYILSAPSHTHTHTHTLHWFKLTSHTCTHTISW